MTSLSAAAAFGSWGEYTRKKVEQMREERSYAFPGYHYQSPSGAVVIDISPDLALRSCSIHPVNTNLRRTLELEVIESYNTAMSQAIVEREHAYRKLYDSKQTGV